MLFKHFKVLIIMQTNTVNKKIKHKTNQYYKKE